VTYTEPLLTLAFILSWLAACLVPRSRARWVLMTGLLAITLICWPPCEYLLSRPLEGRYPLRPFTATQGSDAIVVLSGAVSPPQFERPYALPDTETFTRSEHAAWIHRQTGLPVLVSGGSDTPEGPTFAATMRDVLLQAGVPAEKIWIEDRSHSTHENALFSARVLMQHNVHRIALVVDARSMLRASACFRKENIEVVPAPSRFRYLSPAVDDWIPGWKAVRGNELTLHESLGLLWYRLRGWI
jgi:uncharacterized SAM-binding protein YcdF (DUF218 family)